MVRTLIVGIDTVTGYSLAQHLAPQSEVSGLWFETPEFVDGCHTCRIDSDSLEQQVSEADVIVFCGGAARSSWDADFGDFSAEQQWLPSCIAAMEQNGQRLIFVSSDAVYSGPWVFHDDDSKSRATNKVAKRLIKFETTVAAVKDSLIIRTNVLGSAVGCFLDETAEAIRSQVPIQLDASTFATPIASTDFAYAVESCINCGALGSLNVGGAERITPYRFAIALANALTLQTDLISPRKLKSTPVERSMRCDRLRNEGRQTTPLLRSTLEYLADVSSQPVSEKVAA